MRYCLIVAVLLAGCTINIVDKRLTREDVAAAFKERDAVLMTIVNQLKKNQK